CQRRACANITGCDCVLCRCSSGSSTTARVSTPAIPPIRCWRSTRCCARATPTARCSSRSPTSSACSVSTPRTRASPRCAAPVEPRYATAWSTSRSRCGRSWTGEGTARYRLAGDDVALHAIDRAALLLEIRDGLRARLVRAAELEDHPRRVRLHVRSPDARDDIEPLHDFVDHRPLDERLGKRDDD